MSFVRIEFTDDFFYVKLFEFNISQTLIGNGILVDEGRLLLFSIIWHCFSKGELKRLAFLCKSLANFRS